MLLSQRGAGKSAFINTLFSAVSRGSLIKGKALALDGPDTVTRQLNKYALTDKVSVWDTWGWGGGAGRSLGRC